MDREIKLAVDSIAVGQAAQDRIDQRIHQATRIIGAVIFWLAVFMLAFQVVMGFTLVGVVLTIAAFVAGLEYGDVFVGARQ